MRIFAIRDLIFNLRTAFTVVLPALEICPFTPLNIACAGRGLGTELLRPNFLLLVLPILCLIAAVVTQECTEERGLNLRVVNGIVWRSYSTRDQRDTYYGV